MTESNRRRIGMVVLLAAIVGFLWQCTSAFDRSEDSTPINVFGPWLDDDAEAFSAVLADFTDRTGIPVRYTGSNDFDSDLRQRITRGLGLPDIAVIPQPGLIAELFARGHLAPLSAETVAAIVDNYDITLEQLTAAGEAFLAPYRTNVKSLVWYRPDVFAEQGWGVPTTLDELGELVDEIADSEIAPWCFTIESGGATGWPVTDWIEDLLLRRSGLEIYDQWIGGTLDFGDDHVKEAVREFDELVLAPGRTFGGAQRILSVAVDEASFPMFDDEQGCAMYKQANFAQQWFPHGTEVGTDADVDFFVLPGIEASNPAPILRGGDGLIRFNDRSETSELMTFLSTAEGGEAWVDRGGYLSNRDSVDPDYYAEQDRPFAELLAEDRDDRFDASDTFLSPVRDAWLASLTNSIAENGRLDQLGGLDDVLASVDAVRSELLAGVDE